MAHSTVSGGHGSGDEPTRRDFLYIATGAFAAAGAVVGVVWPLVDQLNPAADLRALAKVDIDLGPVPVGQQVTVMWQGKPVIIRHRTEEDIAKAEAQPVDALIDPATDDERVRPGPDGALKKQYLVMLGNCTHLGCVPDAGKGDYGGWRCPCHGSQFDGAGRVRRGPAPINLIIPEYEYLSDTTIRIG